MVEEFDFPTSDELIASATKFLIEGGENDAASILLACNVADIRVMWTDQFETFRYGVDVNLRGPRVAYDLLLDQESPAYKQVKTAIEATLEHNCSLGSVNVRTDRMVVAPDWRVELNEMARGTLIHNQAAIATKFRLWNNLRFRSQSEIRIAEALDEAGVIVFPNCMARLTGPHRRLNMEPDFLVGKSGKWGILEVDGGEFHPPEGAAKEHERDRLFRAQGVMVERFDAQRCYNEPDRVVSEFLRILMSR